LIFSLFQSSSGIIREEAEFEIHYNFSASMHRFKKFLERNFWPYKQIILGDL